MAATQKSITNEVDDLALGEIVPNHVGHSDHSSVWADVSEVLDNIAEATGLPRREAQFRFGAL